MLEPSFHPFPELSTERLLLRFITKDDLPEIFFLRTDPDVLKHISKKPAANMKEAEEWIERVTQNTDNGDGIIWAIILKQGTTKLIGTICYWNMQKDHYRAEIGYALHPAHWRKGIMKEAIKKVLEYGFGQLGLHSVEARLSPANIGSSSVLESTGFVREGYFKEDFYYNGKFEDTLVYSRLK